MLVGAKEGAESVQKIAAHGRAEAIWLCLVCHGCLYLQLLHVCTYEQCVDCCKSVCVLIVLREATRARQNAAHCRAGTVRLCFICRRCSRRWTVQVCFICHRRFQIKRQFTRNDAVIDKTVQIFSQLCKIARVSIDHGTRIVPLFASHQKQLCRHVPCCIEGSRASLSDLTQVSITIAS